MNATKVTLTSTILAAALGLALGLMSTPAAAHDCSRHNDPDHRHCSGGDSGGDVTIYDVVLNSLSPPGLPDGGLPTCTGTTDIQANPGLDVQMDFDGDCSVSMTVDGSPLVLYPFRLEVKTKKEVTTVRLGFTTSIVLFPVPNDSVYMTDYLPALISAVNIRCFGCFDLTPMTGGETLTKNHQPGRGDETDEGVVIGTFAYTPI